jgi:hypothetical protein
MIHLQIYKHYNEIKTKLNWKVFTKVIKMPNEGSFGLDRQSVLIRREVRSLLI